MFDLLPAAFLFVVSFLYVINRILAFKKREQYFKLYPGLALQAALPARGLLFTRLAVTFLIPTVLLLAVLFPARENQEPVTTTSAGVDILFLVDVSLSMKGTDQQPDRLSVFKQAVLSSLPQLAGNRLGIIAFAGSPFLYCPMTTDALAFADFIRAMDADMIGDNGTNIGEGLEQAKKVVESGKIFRNKIIVMVSDGENLEGDYSVSIPSRILVAGAGTEKGGPIYYSSLENSGYVKRDYTLTANPGDAGVVITRRNTGVLKTIAANHDGIYFNLDNTLGDRISNEISNLDKNQSDQTRNMQRALNSYYMYLLLFLLFLDYMLLEFLINRSLLKV